MWMLKTSGGKKIFFGSIKTAQLVLSTIRRFGDDGFVYKIKTSPLQNTIMVSSIIGNIMSVFDYRVAKERTKAINILRSRVKKFMYTRSRSNKKEFLEAVSYADMAWQESIKHFAKHEPQIEVVATVMRLYSLYAEQLSKYANINEKQIEAFVRGVEDDITLQIEYDSYAVTDFLLEELGKFTGIKRKKLNFIKKKVMRAA